MASLSDSFKLTYLFHSGPESLQIDALHTSPRFASHIVEMLSRCVRPACSSCVEATHAQLTACAKPNQSSNTLSPEFIRPIWLGTIRKGHISGSKKFPEAFERSLSLCIPESMHPSCLKSFGLCIRNSSTPVLRKVGGQDNARRKGNVSAEKGRNERQKRETRGGKGKEGEKR